jgi:hypothetical protein
MGKALSGVPRAKVAFIGMRRLRGGKDKAVRIEAVLGYRVGGELVQRELLSR